MRELDLSKDQLQALLPIAKRARADSKFAVESILRIYEYAHAATNCYKPWAVFTSIVYVGGPPVTLSESPKLVEWRRAGDAQLSELRDKLVAEHAASRTKQIEQQQKGWQGAEFVSLRAPYHVVAGQSCDISVTLKNTGKEPWTAGGKFKLELEGDALPCLRVALGPDEKIQSGQTKEFQFSLPAPANGGYFRWYMRMLKDEGARTYRFSGRTTGPSSPPQRPPAPPLISSWTSAGLPSRWKNRKRCRSDVGSEPSPFPAIHESFSCLGRLGDREKTTVGGGMATPHRRWHRTMRGRAPVRTGYLPCDTVGQASQWPR
jgi:hypothetical protein